MQFSHQGVSFTGLTGMGGAGASQTLIPGWVSEEQLKTVLPLCLALCLWEAGWGEWALCSHFSRLVLHVSCSNPTAFVLWRPWVQQVQHPVGPSSP